MDSLDQYEHGGWSLEHLLIGILPFYGPRNLFLPVIFWSILIIPLLYKGFAGKLYWSIITLIICFIVEIFLHSLLNIMFPRPFPSWDAYYEFLFISKYFVTTPFLMLSAIGIGLWFSRNHNLFAKQNNFIWILLPISLIYIVLYQFFDFRLKFVWGDYNYLFFLCSAFLFLLVMKLLPRNWDNLFSRGITAISKATYHILLTQILYFAILIAVYGDHYSASIIGIVPRDDLVSFLYLLINWAIYIPVGVMWWYIERRIHTHLAYKRILRKSLA